MKNMTNQITEESINNFKTWLYGEERSSGTIEKYLRDIKALRGWLNGREVTKESVAEHERRRNHGNN